MCIPATPHLPTFVPCRIQASPVWMLSGRGEGLAPTRIPLGLKILMWIIAAHQSPSGTTMENVATFPKAGHMTITSSQIFKRGQVCCGAPWA